MSRWTVVITAVLLLGCLAQAEPRRRGGGKGPASSKKPGVFDFYVLSLSWSPQYCAGPAGDKDKIQCGGGRRYGFVVHGLWPQFERGYPSNCGAPGVLPQELVDKMLPLMPSPQLIRHEWGKHGTCDGADAAGYFGKVESAFASLKIPERYQKPTNAVSVEPARFKQDVAAANPKVTEGSLAVLCGGQYLSEVRICLDKNLEPRACSREVRDQCRAEKMVLRPVR